MKIGIMFGNPETTPGGNALKFYSSVRIDMRRLAQIKKGEEVVGNRVKAKVVKNKVAPPFKVAEFDLMFNEGISYEGDLINAGLIYGAVNRVGNSYIFEKDKLGVGVEASKSFLKENPQIAEAIKKAIKEKYKERSGK